MMTGGLDLLTPRCFWLGLHPDEAINEGGRKSMKQLTLDDWKLMKFIAARPDVRNDPKLSGHSEEMLLHGL